MQQQRRESRGQTSTQTRNSGRRSRNDYRRKRLPKSELSLDWARVNVEWTERKLEIMKILKNRRLVTIDQMEYFHSDFGYQSRSQMLLRRNVNKLHEVYMVDKAIKKPVAQWDGTIKKTAVIAIGELGSHLVGWSNHHKRITYQNGNAILPATAHHIIRVHDMEIQTKELMKTMDIEVKAWAYECGSKIVQHSNGLNPDAFCMLHDKQNGKYYTLLLEYDTGKMDLRRKKKFPGLSQKFDRYQEIKNWNGWYERPVSKASENKFPHLFFVTEEESRFPGIPDLLQDREIENTVSTPSSNSSPACSRS